MFTYIAGANSAEQRIGHRMQRDVGIRMSDQALAVRDLNATKDDAVTVTEGMDIIAISGAELGG